MDLYEMLGVEKTATKEDIKKAYQRLAKKNHPDSPERDGDRWQEVSTAYETLSDPGKRKIYDDTGICNPKHDALVLEATADIFMRFSASEDPFKDALRHITREAANSQAVIFECRNKARQVESLMKRVKRTDGSDKDPIRDALTKAKSTLEDRIKSATYVISLMEEVKAELGKYRLEPRFADTNNSQTGIPLLRGPGRRY